MTDDTYRTAVNPYTAKAAEARAKLERERAAAAEIVKQRTDMLREISEGIAPLFVYVDDGVRLSHPQATYGAHLCSEADMLENLPRIIGSTYFAAAAEKLEQSVTTVARRESLDLAPVDRPSLLARLAWPVSATAASAAVSCVIMGDLDPWRIVATIVIGLPINFWWFGTFKRSPP